MAPRRTALCLAVVGSWLASIHAVQADVVWEQSNFNQESSTDASDFLPVNDFTLAAPGKVTDFTVWLSDASPQTGDGDGIANGVFTSFSGGLSWYFFADSAGLPGTFIASGIAAAPVVADTGVDRTDNNEDIFRVSGAITPGVSLNAGTFWFGVREGPPGQIQDGTNILWLSHNGVQGAFAKLFLDGEVPGNLNQAPNSDNAFVLNAVPEPAGIVPATFGLLGLAVLATRRPRR
ncbi:MAG: hypothetical protein HYX69_06710 [Planctomycetia bacterium]|nr:hypothetical protein [Planctomycetia bacterium]